MDLTCSSSDCGFLSDVVCLFLFPSKALLSWNSTVRKACSFLIFISGLMECLFVLRLKNPLAAVKKSNNFIYSSIKKNKILRNEFKQGDARLLHLKTAKHCWKKWRRLKWKDIPLHGLEDLILKWHYLTLLQAMYRFSAVSVKIPMAFYAEMEKLILKLL